MKYKPDNDLVKWNKFKNGDDSSLVFIYSENVKSLYNYGLKFTSDRDVVEDVVHDLFLDLIKARKTLGNTDNIQFYLLKSFRRKLVRQLKKELRYSDGQPDEISFGVHYSIEDGLISEETKNNQTKRLYDAIQRLSPRQKEAIYLKFQKELDYNEISEVLGMGVEACRNLIYRAIKSLKDLLPKRGSTSILFHIFKESSFLLKKIQFR